MKLSIHSLRTLFVIVGASIVITQSACNATQTRILVDLAPIRAIQSPLGDYEDVAWLTDDRLVVWYDPKPEAGNHQVNLWILQSDGSNLRVLDLPQSTKYNCTRTLFLSPIRIKDGKLAYYRNCNTPLDARYPYHEEVFAWDPQSETSQLLYNYDLPLGPSYNLTFAPDMSYGIASGVSDIEHQMYRLDSQAAITINVGMARATNASWSPDGQQIAFFGNKQMSGFAGPGWVGQPYDLWLMPAQCVKDDLKCSDSLTLLLTGIQDPAKAAWSPNGIWLAFDGNLQDHGMGIWLLHMETRQVVQIATGEYGAPEWSPNGKQIVVLAPYETEPINEKITFTYRPRLYMLDMNDLVQQNSSNTP